LLPFNPCHPPLFPSWGRGRHHRRGVFIQTTSACTCREIQARETGELLRGVTGDRLKDPLRMERDERKSMRWR
jgi:hypothetical protein